MTTPELVAVRLSGEAMIAAIDDLWERGEAVLPLADDLPDPALEQLLEAARPAALLEADGRGGVRRRELSGSEPVATDTALVVATSGASATPKLVELSHDALATAARASLDRLGCRRGDRWLLCLPLNHVAGILVLLRARLLGTEPVVHEGFEAAEVATVEADFASLVPTQLAVLLEAQAPPVRLDHVLLGGGPVPPELPARAAEAGLGVTVSYGLTETAGGCVYDGRPLEGVEIAITDRGLIAVRGPTLMSGYRRRPELTRRVLDDGRLITSDRGRWADDGRLEVLGRTDEVIVTGGENVSPRGVAAVLREHPRVADAAVLAHPDPRWGQRVVAAVVPAADGQPSLRELREFARGRLPAHALPRQLQILDTLPRTELGKLDRSRLEALLSAPSEPQR